MFRSPSFLEKTTFARFSLDTPLTFPGNNQRQAKTGYKFTVNDRNNWYDWYNAYLRANYRIEQVDDGTGLAQGDRAAPINGSFSLINKLTVKSGGKPLYNLDNAHKCIFVKDLLDFSDDYSKSVAKTQFWYLDTSLTTTNTNAGFNARQLQSQGLATIETIIPLNRYAFFEELEDKILPPLPLELELALQNDEEMIHQAAALGDAQRVVVRTLELWVPMLRFSPEGQLKMNENFLKPHKWTYLKETVMPSTSRTDASAVWQISPGVKNAKHVFIYFQQTQRNESAAHSPYFFDTFNIDRDNSAKLATCRLQYGPSEFYPELDYDESFKLRILEDALNYSYRKNDYNTGVQLNVANYSNLFPIIYFDLRENKTNVTNDPKQLVFHYRLSETADVNYKVYAIILNEEEIVIDNVGGEIVVV